MFTFTKQLKYGMNNFEVRELQRFLNTHGFKVAETGPGSPGQETSYFGKGTKGALIAFQMAHNIDPIGEFGPITRELANSMLGNKPMTLEQAIIQVESGGNDYAKGDLNIPLHAYGPMQIRQPVCDDVNRVYGGNIQAVDCLGNRALSIDIFNKYLGLYATEAHLGRAPTDQDRARIWNGGPMGYKRAASLGYCQKVGKLLGQL